MSGNLTVNTDKFKVAASTGNVGAAGTFDVSGNIAVNTDKFKVVASTGAIDMSGNITVNTNKFQVVAASGNVDMSGNITVNTNKFKVTASSGNVGAAGTFDVSGNLAVNADKFKVVASSGNLDMSGNLTINTNKFFVDASDSKVGINTATPGFDLDVNGSIATNHAIIFNDASDNGLFANRVNNNTTDFALLQNTDGQTRINCKSGSRIIFTHGSSDIKQEFDGSGNVIIQGNLFSYSDARIKTNVVTIPNALNKVSSLRGVTYNMIRDVEIDPVNARTHVGLIAQEVEVVIPEAVKEENGFKTVAYGNIVGLLIEAIKELRQEVGK